MESPPLVIYDWMVHAHRIFDLYQDYKRLFPPKKYQTMIKGAWAISLNHPIDFLPLQNYRVVVVNDFKDEDGCYWRKHEGEKDPLLAEAWGNYSGGKGKPEAYKGHRTGRNEDFWEVEKIGREYAHCYFPFYSEQGFEADDWAGLAHRLHTGERTMYLSTIDRDWSMLVDDDRNILFANTRVSRKKEFIQKRLVDNAGVILHTKHRLKVDISHPRELAFAKALKGDMGDNLPPGSPVYLFDLVNPPDKWKLENHCPDKASLFKRDMLNPEPNNHLEHIEEVRGKLPQLFDRVSSS
jgi:hypothetical protein